MKDHLALLCSAALLLASAAMAEDTQRARSSGEIFKSLDTDGDGKVSKQEAAANEGFAKQFDSLDGNSDGYVTRRELSRNTMPKPTPGPSY
jgi:Ca2+-binding EF-hand superfamily protein